MTYWHFCSGNPGWVTFDPFTQVTYCPDCWRQLVGTKVRVPDNDDDVVECIGCHVTVALQDTPLWTRTYCNYGLGICSGCSDVVDRHDLRAAFEKLRSEKHNPVRQDDAEVSYE